MSFPAAGNIQEPDAADRCPWRDGKTEDEDELIASCASGRRVEMDDLLGFIGFGPFQWLALGLAGLTYVALVLGGLSVLMFCDKGIREKWSLSDLEYAIVPAAGAIPALLGGLAFSWLADAYGRVWPYLLPPLFTGVFGMASAFTPLFPAFVVARCISAVGVGGMIVMAIPAFIEFLPVRNRARVIMMVSLLSVVGFVMAAGLGWMVVRPYPHSGWQWFIIIGSAPCFLTAIYRLCFPFQSPRYLIAIGSYERAWTVLCRMAWFNRKDLHSFSSKKVFIESVSSHKRKKLSKKLKLLELFSQLIGIFSMAYLRRTLCLTAIVFTQSFGYLGSIIFLPQILSKVPGVDPYFSLLSAFLAFIPGTLLMAVIMEWPRVGRLNTLRLFSFLAALSFLLLVFLDSALATSVLLVMIFFSMGSLIIFLHLYISESYPTTIRASTTGYFFIIEASSLLCGPFLGAYAASFSHHWLYPAVWTGIFVVQTIVAFILNHETYNRSLTDQV